MFLKIDPLNALESRVFEKAFQMILKWLDVTE